MERRLEEASQLTCYYLALLYTLILPYSLPYLYLHTFRTPHFVLYFTTILTSPLTLPYPQLSITTIPPIPYFLHHPYFCFTIPYFPIFTLISLPLSSFPPPSSLPPPTPTILSIPNPPLHSPHTSFPQDATPQHRVPQSTVLYQNLIFLEQGMWCIYL